MTIFSRIAELGRSYYLKVKEVPSVVRVAGVDKTRDFWEMMDGISDYGYREKMIMFKTIPTLLKRLSKPGLSLNMGNVVLDLGSGPKPMSFLLSGGKKRLVTVDFIRPMQLRKDNLHVSRNIKNCLDRSSYYFRRSLVEVSKFLHLDPRKDGKEIFDSVIMSEILNYLPYEEVLKKVVENLKPGGLIIIFNQPGRTFELPEDLESSVKEFILDKDAVKSNVGLLDFASKEMGLQVIYFEEAENLPGYTGEKTALAIFRKPTE